MYNTGPVGRSATTQPDQTDVAKTTTGTSSPTFKGRQVAVIPSTGSRNTALAASGTDALAEAEACLEKAEKAQIAKDYGSAIQYFEVVLEIVKRLVDEEPTPRRLLVLAQRYESIGRCKELLHDDAGSQEAERARDSTIDKLAQNYPEDRTAQIWSCEYYLTKAEALQFSGDFEASLRYCDKARPIAAKFPDESELYFREQRERIDRLTAKATAAAPGRAD
jgi:tetratricopeptide (TPR) repeat protein